MLTCCWLFTPLRRSGAYLNKKLWEAPRWDISNLWTQLTHLNENQNLKVNQERLTIIQVLKYLMGQHVRLWNSWTSYCISFARPYKLLKKANPCFNYFTILLLQQSTYSPSTQSKYHVAVVLPNMVEVEQNCIHFHQSKCNKVLLTISN